jgi:type IV pilus assembly protein PilQ
MTISAPVRRENQRKWLGHVLGLIGLLAVGLLPSISQAQDLRLEAIDVQPLPGQQVELRLRLNGTAPEPMTFTIDDPARISLDLPNTALALDSRRQEANVGPLTTVLAAEANGRTRVVMNLSTMVPYETRVEGNNVIVRIGQAPGESAAPSFAAQPSQSAAPAARSAAAGERSIRNIDFRRGTDGAGQVVVELNDPRTTVDVRQEGGRIVVDFQNTTLPQELLRRLDVTDFATPVFTVDALRANQDTRLIVTAAAEYDQVAYQSDNQFTLELKPPTQQAAATPGVFDEDREYTGERLTLNFQDLETRAVLQLIADFSGLNIVVSDTVQGSVTLRLQNVPWDQALDIVMTTKGLDMRRNGNVVIVAPAEEIAAREQAELEALQALQTLEPLRSEFIQINYAKASELATLIGGAGGGGGGAGRTLLSDRGSVAIDERTNTLLINDTATSLANVRRLVNTLDIPVRQVLIESRVVIVNDDYSRALGVRFGTTSANDNSGNGLIGVTGSGPGAGVMTGTPTIGGAGGSILPVATPPQASRYNVNLPVTGPAGSIALAILGNDYLVDLELSALQAEGEGRVVSTPRIVATNQREARILQGTQIPYQEASSSGATTTSFRDAVLSLTVTPQITPDDRLIMDLIVTKDSVGEVFNGVPSIDKRELTTQVVVNDGETVVLGGIYETEQVQTIDKVPGLGNIPGIGAMFRRKATDNNNAELLIFVTPKILREGARIN